MRHVLRPIHRLLQHQRDDETYTNDDGLLSHTRPTFEVCSDAVQEGVDSNYIRVLPSVHIRVD